MTMATYYVNASQLKQKEK